MRLLAFLRAHTAPDAPRKLPEAAMRDARLTLRELERAARRGSLPRSWWAAPGAMPRLHRLGLLPRLAGGVELTDNEFTGATNAQFATTTNWALGHVPTTSERAVVPATKTCEQKTAREYGALKVRGKFTCTAAGSATLTATVAAPGNAVLDMLGAESVSFLGGIAVSGSYGGVTQTIDTGGFSVKAFTVGAAATGTWKLTNSLTTTAIEETVGVKNNGKGKLELNGQTVKTNKLEFIEGSQGDFTGATIKCTGVSLVLMLNSVGSTFTGTASCTLEVSDRSAAAKVVNGAGKEFGTIIVSGFDVALESLTFGTLKVENSECAAAKGCKLTASASFTGATVTANGTEANPARLESTVSGTAAKLKLPEQELTTGFLAIKDITVETGVVYVPPAHGSNVSGNSIVGTTIKFEAKPGGKKTFEVESSLTARASVASTAIKVAQVSTTLTTQARLQVAAVKAASVASSLSARMSLAATAVKITNTTGTLSATSRLTAAAVRIISTQSALAARASFTSSAVRLIPTQGSLAASSKLTSTVKMVAASEGALRASTRLVAQQRVTMSVTGRLAATTRFVAEVETTVTPTAPTFAYIASSTLVPAYASVSLAVHGYVATGPLTHAYIGSDL